VAGDQGRYSRRPGLPAAHPTVRNTIVAEPNLKYYHDNIDKWETLWRSAAPSAYSVGGYGQIRAAGDSLIGADMGDDADAKEGCAEARYAHLLRSY